jgi:hypothetical protein
MQKIIQIYQCLLKLSRKQENVTDGQTDSRYNYHYLGWVLTWKYLKQGFWEEILVFG